MRQIKRKLVSLLLSGSMALGLASRVNGEVTFFDDFTNDELSTAWTFDKVQGKTYNLDNDRLNLPNPGGLNQWMEIKTIDTFENKVFEADAFFTNNDWLHLGFITPDGHNNVSALIFSTYNTTDTLYARGAVNNNQLNIPLGTEWLNSWHHYKVEWNPNEAVYYIDGEEVARHSTHVPDVPMNIWVRNDGQYHSYNDFSIDNVAITPEPSTLVLLGLSSLAMARRKRN